MCLVDNIKRLCEENGTTIPKVEKALGFGNGAIYNWQKGSPTLRKIQAVADFFEVPVCEILGETDSLEEDFPEGVKMLRRATKELTPEARAKMVRLMKAFLED